jgi:ABC-type uncharacterized transport system fused permease/ATPase subunit
VLQRLSAVVANYGKLLVASRNLDFFTSFYRFLIQLLPAAVVAPLFFAGGRTQPCRSSRQLGQLADTTGWMGDRSNSCYQSAADTIFDGCSGGM